MDKYLKYFTEIRIDETIPILNIDIDTLEKQFFTLPSDYKDFINKMNGCEIFIGENSFIRFIPTHKINEYNQMYGITKYLSNIIMFANNGAGTGYGIKFKDDKYTYVDMDLCSLCEEDNIYCGNTFEDFLKYLYNY